MNAENTTSMSRTGGGRRAALYCLQEGLLALWRNKVVSLLSIGTIAVSFTILGIFLLIGFNAGALAETYGETIVVHLFLRDDITSGQDAELRRLIEGDSRVEGFESVDKEKAAARFRELFPDDKLLIDTFDEPPLPASYEIRLRGGDLRRGAGDVEGFVTSLEGAAGVEAVRYDRQWIETLEAAGSGITAAGVFLGGLLLLAAVVTASNIIKINIYARREEIEIMRLVGADGVYVRGPFIVGGLVQGLLASLLALLGLALFHQAAVGYLEVTKIEFLRDLEFHFLPWYVAAAYPLGGLLLGLLAGLLSFGRAGRA